MQPVLGVAEQYAFGRVTSHSAGRLRLLYSARCNSPIAPDCRCECYMMSTLTNMLAAAVDNDLMTPSFKLKRPQLQKHYQKEIDQMYKDAKKGM